MLNFWWDGLLICVHRGERLTGSNSTRRSAPPGDVCQSRAGAIGSGFPCPRVKVHGFVALGIWED